MIIAAGATLRWIRLERAMRRRLPLPLPWIAPVLAVGAAVATGRCVRGPGSGENATAHHHGRHDDRDRRHSRTSNKTNVHESWLSRRSF